jgi:hypothetical protein
VGDLDNDGPPKLGSHAVPRRARWATLTARSESVAAAGLGLQLELEVQVASGGPPASLVATTDSEPGKVALRLEKQGLDSAAAGGRDPQAGEAPAFSSGTGSDSDSDSESEPADTGFVDPDSGRDHDDPSRAQAASASRRHGAAGSASEAGWDLTSNLESAHLQVVPVGLPQNKPVDSEAAGLQVAHPDPPTSDQDSESRPDLDASDDSLLPRKRRRAFVGAAV